MTVLSFVDQHSVALASGLGIAFCIGWTIWMALSIRCAACKRYSLSREMETRVSWNDEHGWSATESYITQCNNPGCKSTFDAHTADRPATEAEIQTMLTVRP